MRSHLHASTWQGSTFWYMKILPNDDPFRAEHTLNTFLIYVINIINCGRGCLFSIITSHKVESVNEYILLTATVRAPITPEAVNAILLTQILCLTGELKMIQGVSKEMRKLLMVHQAAIWNWKLECYITSISVFVCLFVCSLSFGTTGE